MTEIVEDGGPFIPLAPRRVSEEFLIGASQTCVDRVLVSDEVVLQVWSCWTTGCFFS